MSALGVIGEALFRLEAKVDILLASSPIMRDGSGICPVCGIPVRSILTAGIPARNCGCTSGLIPEQKMEITNGKAP